MSVHLGFLLLKLRHQKHFYMRDGVLIGQLISIGSHRLKIRLLQWVFVMAMR